MARMFETVEQLRRNSERHYGLDFESALEMAYENATGAVDELAKVNAALRKRLDGSLSSKLSEGRRSTKGDGQ